MKLFFLITALFVLNNHSGQESNQSHYTIDKNGTVRDLKTKLFWQKCTLGQENNSDCSGTPKSFTWEDALQECKNLKLAGKKWSLPSREQLITIVDYMKTTGPAIDVKFFPNSQAGGYWSSDTCAQDTSSAWYVNFGMGYIGNDFKLNGSYVRCVSNR